MPHWWDYVTGACAVVGTLYLLAKGIRTWWPKSKLTKLLTPPRSLEGEKWNQLRQDVHYITNRTREGTLLVAPHAGRAHPSFPGDRGTPDRAR